MLSNNAYHANILPSLLALALFGFLYPVMAAEENGDSRIGVKTKGFAIKCCIKGYLQASNFQQLKNNTLLKINRMTDKQFKDEYVQTWAVLKKCPQLVASYKLRPDMTRPEAVKTIRGLSLDDCMDAVDDIPDSVVVDEFNKSVNSPEMENKSFAEQLNLLLSRLFSAGN